MLTGGKLNLRGFSNPPAITIIFALIFQQVMGNNILPVFIWDVITALGNCSIPIGLVLIGASFYEFSGEFKFSRLLRVEISSLLVRNVLFPMAVIFSFIFDCSDVGLVPIKYCFKMTAFIKKLKQQEYQFLQKSIIYVNKKSVKRLLDLVFTIQPPVAPVHIIDNKDYIPLILRDASNDLRVFGSGPWWNHPL